jgi:hypothetical protein
MASSKKTITFHCKLDIVLLRWLRTPKTPLGQTLGMKNEKMYTNLRYNKIWHHSLAHQIALTDLLQWMGAQVFIVSNPVGPLIEFIDSLINHKYNFTCFHNQPNLVAQWLSNCIINAMSWVQTCGRYIYMYIFVCWT